MKLAAERVVASIAAKAEYDTELASAQRMWDAKHAAKILEMDMEMQELNNKYEKEREEHFNLIKVHDQVRAKSICFPQFLRFTRLKYISTHTIIGDAGF